MKLVKWLTLTWILTLFASAAWAQRVEITPFAGYRFGGNITTDGDFFFDQLADFEVADGSSVGVILDFRLIDNLFLEFNLSRQDTKLREDFGLLDPGIDLLDLKVDYYHVGILYQWAPGQIRPFVTASLGGTRFDPDARDLDSLTRFSVGLGGGVKFLFSDHVGLRFEGRGFGTLIEDGDEVYCDFGDCYHSDGTYLWQGEVRAGLVLAF